MRSPPLIFSFFFFNDTATTEIYTLSLHDALPIYGRPLAFYHDRHGIFAPTSVATEADSIQEQLTGKQDPRSEEHTSELQSRLHLVCRLLLEKKKKKIIQLKNLDIVTINKMYRNIP